MSIELKRGIKAHFIKTNNYKTDLCCIFLTLPLKRETVTKTALIPFMLRRGTKRLPNQNLINKEMENMYGAEFNCGIDKIGDNIVLKFYIESIGNNYTLNGEDVLKENVINTLEIAFDPVLENGFFKEEYLKVEKETIRKVIDSKIDDKDTYALDECISSMYGENGFGIYKYGYSEDIDSIDIKDLTEYYNWLIQNAKIDIFVSGNFNEENLLNTLSENEIIKKLNPREEKYIKNSIFTESKQIVDKPKEIFRSMNVTQGKLVIGLDLLSMKNENSYESALIYNAILGGSANSFLFQNVREKAGLAYSARSSLVKQKMNIFVRCGIQIDKYKKAYELIIKQINMLKNGKFSDDDIEDAKTFLISSIRNIKEEQDTEVVYNFGQEISKTHIEPEEYIKRIQAVKRSDIEIIANSIQINTVYFLKN